jgi:hypothetical protein
LHGQGVAARDPARRSRCSLAATHIQRFAESRLKFNWKAPRARLGFERKTTALGNRRLVITMPLVRSTLCKVQRRPNRSHGCADLIHQQVFRDFGGLSRVAGSLSRDCAVKARAHRRSDSNMEKAVALYDRGSQAVYVHNTLISCAYNGLCGQEHSHHPFAVLV